MYGIKHVCGDVNLLDFLLSILNIYDSIVVKHP